MVWYPTLDNIIVANKRAVRNGKHPHKLRRSREALQSLIDDIRASEPSGLTYQAARFLKELVYLHAFDGGNHRTAYLIANLFLLENGTRVRNVPSSVSYGFVRQIGKNSIGEVQAWILENMVGSRASNA